jgi:TonB family protein
VTATPQSGWLFARTVSASLALHAVALALMIDLSVKTRIEIYADGTGNDAFRREQTIAVDVVSAGEATEDIHLAEVIPLVANTTPSDPLPKPPEPDPVDVVATDQSPAEVPVAKDQPPTEPRKPEQPAVADWVPQTEIHANKSAGDVADGGKATALSAYVGQIHGALQRAKAGTAGAATGKVIVGFALDTNGRLMSLEIISSSGVSTLDRAAVEWLERATFPPLPGLLASGQRFNVPLTFAKKSS